MSQSKHVDEIYFAPGNGGTSANIDIKSNDIPGLISFAKKHSVLTIVGPEEPLSLGIVDAFENEGLRVFGPSKQAAMLEVSKAFAKEFMKEAAIPTAKFAVFTDSQKAKDYVSKKKSIVIKADGLASGKGVVVCDNADQATMSIDSMMTNKEFGIAGSKVVIEERLFGEEVSFIALCDGTAMMPLASSQDHKRVFDGDKGPNTGGMGAYSPAPILDDDLYEKIVKRVMEPALNAMKKRGTPFRGFLYAGVMVSETGDPHVLEFNARMGDPECQPIMMRMNSDMYEYIDAAVDGRLSSMSPIMWKEEMAVCVVMSSRGYPGGYQKGQIIEGLDSGFGEHVMVFHAGTTRNAQNKIVTNGGRVLGVTALGKDPRQAIDNVYSAVRKIHWGENGHHYRTDIARRAIAR